MKKEILFYNNKKEVFTNVDLLNSLKSIKANECDVLYIHTSLNFGIPNTNIKKNELLQLIVDTRFPAPPNIIPLAEKALDLMAYFLIGTLV